jgi:hypothetical protein
MAAIVLLIGARAGESDSFPVTIGVEMMVDELTAIV